ncbi:26379_t:CDS:2, partial [Dentiscutata erythropus]
LEKTYLDLDNNPFELSTNLNKFFISTPPKTNTKISSHTLTWTLNQENDLMLDIVSFTSILILEIQKQFSNNPFVDAMKIFKLSDWSLNNQTISEFAVINSNDTRIEWFHFKQLVYKNYSNLPIDKLLVLLFQLFSKYWLRNGLNNDTLHMFIMVGLEETDVMEFNFNDALKIWYQTKERKINKED